MRILPLLLLAATAVATPGVAAPAKPNIICILADDIGLPGFSCTGGIYPTPHIDALAAGGTRFENCFAAPLCGPSRAMLLTGRYAFRTGVTDNGRGKEATPQKDGCVALLLKQAGYATAVAGKWSQLGYFATKEEGVKWGFDESIIWGVGSADPDAGTKKKKSGGPGRPDRYWSPDYFLNGALMTDIEDQYGPDVLHGFVVDFIRRHRDGPFFVYYPTPLIHGPILRTPDTTAADAPKQKGKSAAPGAGSLYADNIAYLDKLVGKLVAALEEMKLRENTLIVFTGDNGSVPIGTVHGRPVDGKKSQVNEGGSRVPLIANWPGVTPKGVVSKDLRDFTDLLPTFAALAGATLPTERKIDGRSFAPQLRGEPGQPREWAYVQLHDDRYVRSDRWKLTGKGELFDMKDAPYQQIAVASDSTDAEAKAARMKLQAALDTLHDDSAPAAPEKKRKKKKGAQ